MAQSEAELRTKIRELMASGALPVGVLQRLAKALGVPVTELLT